jgi:ribulose-5-phosphate 4-epimerase/fuculose-1-phosphate aldolase
MQYVAEEIKSDLVKYARLSAAMGLTPNTQGNLSARDPNTGYIAVTPHDLSYDIMTPDDIVIVDVDGMFVAGRHEQSSETPVHCAVYRARPDVMAIVHSEPVYTNCFGAAGMPIEPVVVALVVDIGGSVPVMPFMPSGSDAFGEEMIKVMGDRNGVIWGNHGLLTIGPDLDHAFRRTVIIENVAHIYYLTFGLGVQPKLVRKEMLDPHKAIA